MSDFLPIEPMIVPFNSPAEMAAQAKAETIGVAAPKLPRTMLRPSIVTSKLPTTTGAKGGHKMWPKIINRCHGSTHIQLFENGVIRWISGSRRAIHGSPVAYHPFNQKALGQIQEQQARGFANLVRNDDGSLVIQGPGDPVPGHCVSRTAYQRQEYDVKDPRRYLNASQEAYVCVPLEMMMEWKATFPLVLGAECIVVDLDRNQRFSAVVGDVDLHGIGGMSDYVWKRWGILPDSWPGRCEFTILGGKAAKGYELQRWKP